MEDINEEMIFTYMINIPGKSFSNIDRIFCNADYEPQQKGQSKPVKFDGIHCTNYRAVGLTNRPDTQVYLNVGHIDLNDASHYDKLIKGITDERMCENSQVQSFLKRGLLNSETTIYFKGAYTNFPKDWINRNLTVGEIGDDKYNIYRNATRGILIKILLLLRNMGYKTLVVDPEPGYHPATATDMSTASAIEKARDARKRKNGLVKLYTEMGLEQINCALVTGAFSVIYSDLENRGIYRLTSAASDMGRDAISYLGLSDDAITKKIKDMREAYNHVRDNNKDVVVMIGDIGKMIQKIDFAISGIGSLVSFFDRGLGWFYAAREIDLIQDFNKVKSKVLTSEKYSILPDFTTNIDGDHFKQKYLKYKSKYLELKQSNIGSLKLYETI